MRYAIDAKAMRWRGIDFKSQLEAFWHETFLLANLEPEYEPITVPTPNGPFGSYTPDFRLIRYFYVEIKPYGFASEANDARIRASGLPVMSIFGSPRGGYNLVANDKLTRTAAPVLDSIIKSVQLQAIGSFICRRSKDAEASYV